MASPDSDLAATAAVLSQARRLCDDFRGRAGFFVRDLRTSVSFGWRARESFPTASMIKLPVLVELFYQVEDGRFHWTDAPAVRAEDHVPGSGVLRHLSPGLRLPWRDLAYLMMAVSDNTATNLLIERVGIAAVNDRMQQLGCADLVLRHPIDFRYLWTEPEHLGVGSPEHFADLLEKVWRRQILTPAACAEMLRMMDGVGADRAGRYLPINPSAPQLAAHGYPVEPTVQFAGKTGSLIGVRGQVAAVWDDHLAFVLAVMTAEGKDYRGGIEHEGAQLAARLGKLVYDHFRASAPAAS